jgi:hypothetical protein
MLYSRKIQDWERASGRQKTEIEKLSESLKELSHN